MVRKKRKRKAVPEKEKFALHVPKDHLRILRKMSDATGGELSVSYFVRMAIRDYLGKQKKKRT